MVWKVKGNSGVIQRVTAREQRPPLGLGEQRGGIGDGTACGLEVGWGVGVAACTSLGGVMRLVLGGREHLESGTSS